MRLEDRDHPPVGAEGARRGDRRRDLGRVVRVVVDDERAPGGLPQPLEAPARPRERADRPHRVGGRDPGERAGLERRHGVARVVQARHPQHDVLAAPREPRPLRRQRGVRFVHVVGDQPGAPPAARAARDASTRSPAARPAGTPGSSPRAPPARRTSRGGRARRSSRTATSTCSRSIDRSDSSASTTSHSPPPHAPLAAGRPHDPADEVAGVQPALEQHVGDHRRRRRLAVGPGHRDRAPQGGQLGEEVLARADARGPARAPPPPPGCPRARRSTRTPRRRRPPARSRRRARRPRRFPPPARALGTATPRGPSRSPSAPSAWAARAYALMPAPPMPRTCTRRPVQGWSVTARDRTARAASRAGRDGHGRRREA